MNQRQSEEKRSWHKLEARAIPIRIPVDSVQRSRPNLPKQQVSELSFGFSSRGARRCELALDKAVRQAQATVTNGQLKSLGTFADKRYFYNAPVQWWTRHRQSLRYLSWRASSNGSFSVTCDKCSSTRGDAFIGAFPSTFLAISMPSVHQGRMRQARCLWTRFT